MKASFVSRISAFIIDYLIIYLFLAIIISGSFNNNILIEKLNSLNEQYSSNEITTEEYTESILKVNYNIQKNRIATNIISTIVLIGYYIIFAYLNDGQTLGKKVFKIKVVNKNGKKPSIKNMVLRSLFIYGIITNLFNIIFVNLIDYKYYGYGNLFITYFEIGFSLICALMILHKKDARGLHDLIAGTYVIREER